MTTSSCHSGTASNPCPLLRPEAIRFAFVGYGAQADAALEGPDRLYLDVGNELRPGVIDHHHLAAYQGSTAGLVVAHPDLVRDVVPPGRDPAAPLQIMLHADPDLDCVVSAYLASAVLTTGQLPPGAAELARYVDCVDGGHVGLSQEFPFSLYAAYMLLAHRLTLRVWATTEDRWRACVEQALPLVGHVAKAVTGTGRSVLEVDAFSCPGLFGPQDRSEVRLDIERYRAKLRDPRNCARPVRLRLPGQFGGTAEVDALLVRDVQDSDDPGRVLFFKDWARTDRDRAPERAGFVGLSVFMARSVGDRPRCIISVRPDAGVSLRGLAARLDAAESARRQERYEVDDRSEDPGTHEPRPARPGFANADPWYDGRAHADTIVDSPRSGTYLSADEIERIVLEYGGTLESGGAQAGSVPIDPESPAGGDVALRQWSALVGAWRDLHGSSEVVPTDIFLSYPHARTTWVEGRLYAYLTARRPDLRIFLDKHSLRGGVAWLAHLAEKVDTCRVFLPVYCEEYFRSDFCQWELQLAVARDPLGRRQIVIPVQLGSVLRPSYCKLIQVEDAERFDFLDRLDRVLNEVLPRPTGGQVAPASEPSEELGARD
jgi:TIR domain